MNVDHEAYAAACVAIDRAAIDPSQWSIAVDQLALATGSRAGELIGIDPASSIPLHIITDFCGDMDELLTRWVGVGGSTPQINPMIRAGLAAPAMQTLLDHKLVSADERRRQVLWNEVFDPFDIPHLGSMVIHKDGPDHLVVGVLRAKDEGPLESEALRVFEECAARMRAATALSRALAHEASLLMTSALEAIHAPAIALSGWGRIVGMTAAAQRLVLTTRCLRVVGDRLAVVDGRADARLKRAVRAGRAGHAGEVVIAHHPARRLKLSIHPLAASLDLGFGAKVLITLREVPATEHLTPAEQTVLEHLVNGLSIDEIASRRGASRETIRSQSKSIYAKLNVSGQVELMRSLPEGWT